jgi:hypothetical protein
VLQRFVINEKQLENVEYFSNLGSLIKNYTTRTVKLNRGLPWQKQHSRTRLFISKLNLNLKKKLVKCYIWSIALYGAETWTLRKVEQEYLESFEM